MSRYNSRLNAVTTRGPIRLELAMACLLIATALTGHVSQVGAQQSDDGRLFETHIRPVLVERCVKCHGQSKHESNLRLDSREAMLKGGDSGASIVTGSPEKSLLLDAIRHNGLEMPPNEQLPDETIGHFSKWIAGGAAWPQAQAQLRSVEVSVTDKDRQWWAFQPLRRPTVPSSDHDDWSANPIDRFVLKRLQDAGITPSPQADKTKLVRRIYLDLLGLPPTPEQIDAFLSDQRPDAWEHLVEQLLADPGYGEHWARFWLDLVRYAESDGWKADDYRPHAWQYRDYVVRAFNEDVSYADFVRQQLAGDQLSSDSAGNLAAVGFLRLGIYEYNQRNAKQHWKDIVDEITDVTGDVFLGMGMACARCHDHKFDPILRRDYYRLRAFFEPLLWRDDQVLTTRSQRVEFERQQQIWLDATREIREQIDAIQQPYMQRKADQTVDKFPLEIQAAYAVAAEQRSSWQQQMAYLVERQFVEEGSDPLAKLKDDDKDKLRGLERALKEFDHLKPNPYPPLMTVADHTGHISPTTIPDLPEDSDPIAPGYPCVLDELPIHRGDATSSGRRRQDLAEWIVSPDNPLTTRVIVNRVWQQHFDRGLVATPNDFGRLGEIPSHPDLLDWLATEFIARGWSFKELHRMILTSSTWRQSAQHPQAVETEPVDPENRWLWRAPVRRMTAEQVNDAVLVASGQLDRTVGGPSVDGDSRRRALYIKRYRNTKPELLEQFDVANGLKSVPQRDRTTTPTQSLLMLNGSFLLSQAAHLADRIDGENCPSIEQWITRAFWIAWGREPASDDLQAAVQYLQTTSDANVDASQREKRVDLCHVLLTANEFLYVD